MRGPRITALLLAGLMAGCYQSHPLMDLDDALVDPEADPDLVLEPASEGARFTLSLHAAREPAAALAAVRSLHW